MKCKTFKIHLLEEAGNLEETKFNDFLESVTLSQIFASVVGSEFWSIVVFYEEGAAVSQSSARENRFAESGAGRFPQISRIEDFQPVKTTLEKPSKIESVPVEPIVLTAEQEKRYLALRNWRNDQASQNGLAPYMIAHNDSLMQIAIVQVKSKEDLLQIKGFGEKRAEKYGDEILTVLSETE